MPDYRALMDPATSNTPSGSVREATSAEPRDAKQIGEEWLVRLKERGALHGYGRADTSPNAAVSVIDTGLTEREFDGWVRENRWIVPTHIRWSFVSEMLIPSVSDAALSAIRYWPASVTRTGIQLQALHGGRIELRDGCFHVATDDRLPSKLAWFHAEMGLDVDDAGYFVLRDRVDGSVRARLGETMNWAGPASATIDDSARKALHQACGSGDILVVGSPESSQRFQLRISGVRTGE